MAVLVYAVYGMDKPELRHDRQRDGVKRSLVRRLYRELQSLEPAGVL